MLFRLVEPLTQFRNIHAGQLGDVLIPYFVAKRLAIQTLSMTFGTDGFSQELVGPLLARSRVVVLHDLPQILDDAVERHEVVARSMYQFLVDAYVFERAVEHFP